MLAAGRLYPQAVPVLPRQMNRNLEAFLAVYRDALPFVRLEDLPRRRIDHVILVDTQAVQPVRGMSPDTTGLIIDHHPLMRELAPGWSFSGEEVGATTTLLVEKLAERGLARRRHRGHAAGPGHLRRHRRVQLSRPPPSRPAQRGLAAGAWGQPADRQQVPAPPADRRAARTSTSSWPITASPISSTAIRSLSPPPPCPRRWRRSPRWPTSCTTCMSRTRMFMLVQMARPHPARGAQRQRRGGCGQDRGRAGRRRPQPGGRGADPQRRRCRASTKPWSICCKATSGPPSPWARSCPMARRKPWRPTPPSPRPPSGCGATASRASRCVEGGRIVGMLTRREIDRAVHHGLDRHPVSRYMRAGEVYVTPDDSVETLRQVMTEQDWGQVPVLDPQTGALLGIVTRTDLIKQWAIDGAGPRRDAGQRMESGLPAPLLDLLRQAGDGRGQPRLPALRGRRLRARPAAGRSRTSTWTWWSKGTPSGWRRPWPSGWAAACAAIAASARPSGSCRTNCRAGRRRGCPNRSTSSPRAPSSTSGPPPCPRSNAAASSRTCTAAISPSTPWPSA